MRILTAALVIAALGLVALSASADVNIGGEARFTAMGGAGLASTDSPAATATINPAAVGMLPKRLGFKFPNVSLRVDGASLDDISSWANDIYDLSGQQGIDLAREFGKHETMLDVSAATGFVGSPISATVDGEARVRIIPNAAFQQFAQTGTLPADPTQMSAVIWAEAAAAMPSVAFGFKVPHFAAGKGDLWIGTRIRSVRGKYVRRTISWSGSTDPNDLLATSNEPVQDESGIGADLGLIYRPAARPNLSFGLAVTNLLKPSLGNIAQETIWSVGMAVKPNRKTLVVADIVNLTDAYDEGKELRLGIEVKPIRALAFRAGYSGDGFTTGIGVFGIDVAFASDMPLSISRTVRF
jgi:hypothetical protein